MIKLITIDLDGTLFDKEKKISQKNIEAIKEARKNGVYVVIATGRPINGVLPVLKQLNMNTEKDYLISYNGAMVFNIKTKEIVYKTTINGSDVKRLFNLSKKYNANIHAFRENEELITPKSNIYTDVETRINHISEKIYDFNNINDSDSFLKCMIVDAEETLDIIQQEIKPSEIQNLTMVRSSKIFLEFLNSFCDKGLALEALAKHLNIPLSDTMAIGDAGNDLSMIQRSGFGVCMSNGFSEVKSVADYITLSNEESGVAHAINKFVNQIS